jgi:hypothetical protein
MRELMVDPALVAEAWAHNIPCPFYEVSLTAQALNGRAATLKVQFEDMDAARAYAGDLRPGEGSPARDAIEAALNGPLVTTSGGLQVCYDPREWDGGPIR